MRPLPEHRPSWLSTILFALVAFFFFSPIWVLIGATASPWQSPDSLFGNTWGAIALFWLSLGLGVVSAILAGWGWRAPREKRFHICYLSGVLLLALSFYYVRATQKAAIVYEWSGREKYPVDYSFAAAPLVSTCLTTLALVLILAALNLDRR